MNSWAEIFKCCLSFFITHNKFIFGTEERNCQMIRAKQFTFPKRADETYCDIYGGFSLLESQKMLSFLLLSFYSADLWQYGLCTNQARFRRRSGCADQIFTLIGMLASLEISPIHRYIFHWLCGCFESIGSTVLWKVIERDDIQRRLIRLINAFY